MRLRLSKTDSAVFYTIVELEDAKAITEVIKIMANSPVDVTGPDLPLLRSENAAVQLSLSGRSCFAQHLDRFMGIRPNDVANRDTCGAAALHLQH